MIDINKKPNLSIIVAQAENRAIGKNNDLLWHLSGDLKRFKALTMGHPVVMGRRTWESLPKRPLPGRRNIVLTQNPDFVAEGAEVVHSVNGAAIYELLLPFTNRLYVTHVYRDFDGDVFFPVIDMSEFNLVKLSEPMFDEESGLDYAYEEYDRKPMCKQVNV